MSGWHYVSKELIICVPGHDEFKVASRIRTEMNNQSWLTETNKAESKKRYSSDIENRNKKQKINPPEYFPSPSSDGDSEIADNGDPDDSDDEDDIVPNAGTAGAGQGKYMAWGNLTSHKL